MSQALASIERVRYRIFHVFMIKHALSQQQFHVMVKPEGLGAYQWRGAGVDELVLCPCRHHHQVASLDVLVFAIDGGFANAGSEGQCLVNGVDLSGSILSAIAIQSLFCLSL